MSVCQIARARLARYVEGLGEKEVTKAATLMKAGKLANPKTIMRNLAGNAAMLGWDQLATQPARVAVDHIIALGKSARSVVKGAPQGPAAFRTTANTFDAGGFEAARKGWRHGVAMMNRVMRTGIDPDFVNERFDIAQVNFENPVARVFVEKVYGIMAAGDKPYFSMGYQLSLYSRAKVLVGREGLKGAGAEARLAELMRRPTDEMVMGATEDAMRLTFRQETPEAKALGRMKRELRDLGRPTVANPKGNPRLRQGGQAGYFLAEAFLPFISTPAAVARTSLAYSPAGLIGALADQLNPALRGQEALVDALAKAGVGTAAGVGLGWYLAEKGMLTGASSSSSAERAHDNAEGRTENAIRIGDRWYSLSGFAPVSLMPLWGANLYFSAKERGLKTMGEAVTDLGTVASTGAAQAKSFTEQTFLRGVHDVLTAVTEPERNGARVAAAFIKQLNPLSSITGSVSRAVDPMVRDARGVTDQVIAGIPGVSRALPAKVDQFGQEIRREGDGVTRPLREIFDPTMSRKAKDDAMLTELRRLEVFVGYPGRTIRVLGEPVKRSGDEYRALLREVGPVRRQRIEQMMAMEEYQNMPDEARAKLIRRIVDGVSDQANDRFRAAKVDSVAADLDRRRRAKEALTMR